MVLNSDTNNEQITKVGNGNFWEKNNYPKFNLRKSINPNEDNKKYPRMNLNQYENGLQEFNPKLYAILYGRCKRCQTG